MHLHVHGEASLAVVRMATHCTLEGPVAVKHFLMFPQTLVGDELHLAARTLILPLHVASVQVLCEVGLGGKRFEACFTPVWVLSAVVDLVPGERHGSQVAVATEMALVGVVLLANLPPVPHEVTGV